MPQRCCTSEQKKGNCYNRCNLRVATSATAYQGNSCSEQSPECEQGSSYNITQPPEDPLMHTVHQILGTDKFEQKKESAMFILHLKEVKCLSESAVQSVISSYQGMLKYSVQRIQAGINEKLHSNGINPDDLNLAEVFTNATSPFDGLSSIYLQERFYSEHMGCIVSVQV